MKKTAVVDLPHHQYPIVAGWDILSDFTRLLKSHSSLGPNPVVITHAMLWRLYGREITAALKAANCQSVDVITVKQGESSKSAQCVLDVIARLARLDVKKKIWCLALGGGVIGDLSGFVAAIYKRGIPYVQMPTTLLAQVDSAIGGKTGIDLDVGKNLVGAYYHPQMVISDGLFLSSLSRRQISNGLAEVIKYGIIADAKFFQYLEKHIDKALQLDQAVLSHIIAVSSQIKARIVTDDPVEKKGQRLLLNFGHTVGHAIEAAAGFETYQHGEAIAIGMCIASRVSVYLKLLSPLDEKRIHALLKQAHLPLSFKGLSLSVILKHMKHDKKWLAGQLRFIVAKGIGHAVVRHDIDPKLIERAILDFSL